MEEKNQESAAIKAARARVAALKLKSNKLTPEEVELAECKDLELAELNRLDREGREALRQRVTLLHSDVVENLPEDKQASTSVESVYDWPTHKRTGRGVMIVTSLGRDNAILSLKNATKHGAGGIDVYDSSDAAVLRDLLEACLYPDSGAVQTICHESPIFARSVQSQVMLLSGLVAKTTAGKSES